jgi:hypothetical protein
MWSIESYGGFNVGICGSRPVEGFTIFDFSEKFINFNALKLIRLTYLT